MKLAAYLRVSSETQLDGLGLEVQETGISSWAGATGHEVVAWYRDEGVSGSNGIDTRRGLYDALNLVRDGAAAGLVVYRLDRLARLLTVQESTLAAVWALGGSVFSVDHGEILRDDPDDPMRTALRQMIGVFAQLERGMIVSRLRSGRRQKHLGGGYAGYGSPPFGYRAEAGELVPIPHQQAVVTEISRLRAEGLSLSAVAAALNAAGHSTKRGSRWSAEQVRRVLLRTP